MADGLSDNTALYHEWPASDCTFLSEFHEAFRRWFTAMSKRDKLIAHGARLAFDRGDDAEA
jgi:hypothetical protein